jgi:hypothetical protein
MFTANAPACFRLASVADANSMQTTSEGGVSESDANAVTVQPARSPPLTQVRIATPEANSRIARRKFALSASGRGVLIASGSSSISGDFRSIQSNAPF